MLKPRTGAVHGPGAGIRRTSYGALAGVPAMLKHVGATGASHREGAGSCIGWVCVGAGCVDARNAWRWPSSAKAGAGWHN